MKYAFEKKNFKNSPNKHNWTVDELAAHYKIANRTVVNELFPVIGRKTVAQQRAERRDKIIAHPLFGKKGERAPCPAKEVANAFDCSTEYIAKLRRKQGVKPISAAYDFTGKRKTPGLLRGRDGKKSGPYQLTKEEKEMYSLIRMCYTWGRPEGIDAHLEAIASG